VTDLARPAAELAGAHADDVDRRGRFPAEAVQALRQAGLLSCAVPVHLGGHGLNLAEVGALTGLLGRHCASTLVLAPADHRHFVANRGELALGRLHHGGWSVDLHVGSVGDHSLVHRGLRVAAIDHAVRAVLRDVATASAGTEASGMLAR